MSSLGSQSKNSTSFELVLKTRSPKRRRGPLTIQLILSFFGLINLLCLKIPANPFFVNLTRLSFVYISSARMMSALLDATATSSLSLMFWWIQRKNDCFERNGLLASKTFRTELSCPNSHFFFKIIFGYNYGWSGWSRNQV